MLEISNYTVLAAGRRNNPDGVSWTLQINESEQFFLTQIQNHKKNLLTRQCELLTN